eukprot:9382009-Pyramimonas_sp.AAC.2
MDPKSSDLGANPVFPEVPYEFVNKLSWRTANFRPIFNPEAIHISEMRGFMGTIRKRLLGDQSGWHKPFGVRRSYWAHAVALEGPSS